MSECSLISQPLSASGTLQAIVSVFAGHTLGINTVSGKKSTVFSTYLCQILTYFHNFGHESS